MERKGISQQQGIRKILFVAVGGYGLIIYDLSVPESPEFLKQHQAGIDGEVCGLFIKDKRLYVVTKSRLLIYDVNHENREEPLIYMGGIDIPGQAYKVCVSQKYAFVAAGSDGIHIINVSNPANPRIIDSVLIPGGASSIGVTYTGAYVSTETGDFHSVCVMPPL